MLEFLICSMLTIFPDFLYRRYVQGKRVGHEINLYSMWFELRWGITACVILTLSLITLIFYFHPSTTNVTSVFRTVTILPEVGGRVSEVYVTTNEKVGGGPAAVPPRRQRPARRPRHRHPARRRARCRDGGGAVRARRADAVIVQARSAYQQALDELETKQELMNRGSNTVSQREIEQLREPRRRPPGRHRRGARRQADAGDAHFLAAAGAEGERRGGAGAGGGRARQDAGRRRRRRHRAAVRAQARRRRQPDAATGRHPGAGRGGQGSRWSPASARSRRRCCATA